MTSARLQNALFVLLVMLALGATAWSAAVREPGLFTVRLKPVPAAAPAPKAEQKAAEKKEGAAANLTEQMIEQGKLSKHPAKHVRRMTP